jgi:type III pantothenate kinase
MLLAIDVGNTQTVVGLYDDTDLVDHWRIATNAERTSDEHALLLTQFLEQHGFSFDDDITGIAVSSVVPRLTAVLREMTDRYFRFDPVVIEPGIKSGVPILYDNPREVGADRIANAVGALDIYGGPAVVVDFGTATTFDAISANGEYLGGAIVPGIEISMDALFARAAWLRRVELVEPRHVIGRSTIESIEAGVVYGTVELVDGMVRRFEEELGKSNVIATGGLGSLIAPLSDTIEHLEPWLTLHGLRLIHQKNAAGP